MTVTPLAARAGGAGGTGDGDGTGVTFSDESLVSVMVIGRCWGLDGGVMI
jgi:hypothetical protein